LTARGGKDSGGPSPPLPGVRSSNGGRTRWRHPRPGARWRCWLRRTRANWGKRGCLGACWGWCGFKGVLGGGFYRPGGRGQGWPEGGRCGGSGDVHGQSRARRPWGRAGGVRSWRRGTVGTRWRAHAGRHRAERQRGRRGGPGGFPPFLSMSHGPGRGRGGWGSTEGESTVWLQGEGARSRRHPQ
jgi:hypothetical protein